MKRIFIVVLSLTVFLMGALSSPLSAQWVQTNGPDGEGVLSLAASPNGAGGMNLFAGTSGTGLYLSTNDGTNWIQVDSGMEQNHYGGTNYPVVYSIGTNPNGAGGATLFAGTYGNGVYLSNDNGTSWVPADSGLASLSYTYFDAFAIIGANLFVGANLNGVFLSTNNGATWTAVNSGMNNLYVQCLEAVGTSLFAGTADGVYLSTNNGTSWASVDSGLPTPPSVFSFAEIPNGEGGTNLFAGTQTNGVFLSTNSGTSWTAVDSGLTNLYVECVVAVGTSLFAGTYGNGVYLSTNNGTRWTPVDSGLTDHYISCFAVIGANLFAGTADNAVWMRPLSEMITTSVPQPRKDLPMQYALEQNYPNPFNPTTSIQYALPRASYVKLTIYDILGRAVNVLVNGMQTPGYKSVSFNASQLPSGVYLYRLQAENYTATKKLLLVK